MCGINGIVSDIPEIKQKITFMNRLLKHRGPDDEGFVLLNSPESNSKIFSGDDSIPAIKNNHPHISESFSELSKFRIVLGHRRLSIIDLSENGHGPMASSDGELWITYNGEIYNYIELREELVELGYKFRTKTDTEVILLSYLHWGTECLNKFNGMWAFGLWDNTKKILLLARDRFGIKPLYFSLNEKYFAFSSEIKPLVHLSGVQCKINSGKIPFFLLYGNRLNSRETFIKDIYSLRPSHFITYDLKEVHEKKYYEIGISQRNDRSEEELKDDILCLLKDSIKLRFRSDVPVGTCLSGGFDSSSIVSLSTKNLNTQNNLQTFSAVWKEKECDESYYIDIVNNKYGCIPNKTTPKPEEFEEVFRRLNYHQEIPTEGPGLYPQWYVMREAKGKVKVLLDGQGGDEVFGGYFLLGAYLRSLIKDRKFLRVIRESRSFLSFLNNNGLHSFAGWLFPRQYGYLVRSRLSRKSSILRRDLPEIIGEKSIYFDAEPPRKFRSYISNLSYHFITNITIPALLHYEDRSSMAHSIESRIPFLDYRLVELGLNLKPEYLSYKGISRPLYRKTLEPYLPKEITSRRDKLGFPTPFSVWTRTILKDLILDTLTDSESILFDYIRKDVLISNLNKHFEGKIDYSWEIWRLLSLNSIFRIYKNPIVSSDF